MPCAMRVITIVVTICLATTAVAQFFSERELRVRPLAVASRAERIGVLVGRLMVAKRWNELLDELLYAVAPRGTWDERHTAWAPARKALAAALRRASVARLESSGGRLVHDVIVDRYLDVLNDEERARAT